MGLDFVKMHGLGNDFILLDATQSPLTDTAELAIRMCDRHFGVGADGLLIAEPSQQADFRMRIVNSDGSEARMCGNGIRCMAMWAWERGLVRATSFAIETLGGVMRPRLVMRDGELVAVEVNMGPPYLARQEIPMTGDPAPRVVREKLTVGDRVYPVTAVSMGNPHCVIFLSDMPGAPPLDQVPLEAWGRPLEHHLAFPQRTNVEFVEVRGPGQLAMRVWERGAGPTLACGTGACATLVAANLCGLSGREATVHLPGGPLSIAWREDGNVYMTGPAVKVFEGVYQPALQLAL
ncbi:MAG TPA: diaminopimelate epimerase [Candidatus Xenobia bacterium]|jgi:diaminopimelate epimerase